MSSTRRSPGQLRSLASWLFATLAFVLSGLPARAFAQAAAHAPGHGTAAGHGQHQVGGEANIILPDLSTTQMLGTDGRTLLMGGLVVCALGLLFGLLSFSQLNKMPVHKSMRDIS